ncbi:Ternary complex factor MIP1, leucine-zipper [Parasponia andersonii]|uniref:Ternary complex factor MIP1, leucine-zipper n=1 Tax=Parasponia andersonii TaxID=3476 RepID=A0A2P5AHA5_PARAD|nr:Ternary complex factor MIP1, leucine-zipper [Parasponia andersonii]
MRAENSRSSFSSCPSPPPPCSTSKSAAHNGFLENLLKLNMSPRLSSYLNPMAQSDRTSSDQTSLCWDSEKAVASTSISSVSSNDTHTPKWKQSSVELKEEIATLELEILHLERHLLSLYRTAFEGQLSTLPSTPTWVASNSKSVQSMHSDRCAKLAKLALHHQKSPAAHPWTSQSHVSSQNSTPKREQKASGHRSLADHLGGSCIVKSLSPAPDRLSEDIVRCISSIYCKLANPTQPKSQAPDALSASPASSFSSSTIFSSKNACDSWSPRYNYGEDAITRSHHQLKQDTGPYASMIQVLKIRLDDDSFNYASRVLHNFRSLVRNLEKVDPRKMKREEKIAFWINIHNALVMHAHLAYGTGNRVKSASVLKSAYNVGGHCINAYVIQSSILGIRSQHSGLRLQTLLPGRKPKARSIRHEYALEYPEPLVHFALCSGDYFDPAVRAYSAKNIFRDLEVAKEEFIEASVYIHKETKVLVPRLMELFSKDMSLSMQELLDVILESLSSDVERRDLMRRCIKSRSDKCLHWLPHTSTFRYVIHADLAKD